MNTSTALEIDLEKQCPFPLFFKTICATLLLLVMLLSVFENVIFCHAVYCSKRLHRKSMVLIVNLSVSDIIISCFVPSFQILITLYHPDWPLGEVGTYIFNCAWLFSIVSPFVIVVAITFERYLSLTKPALCMKYATKRLMKGAVIVLWLYSLAWVTLLGNTMHFKNTHVYEWNVNFDFYYAFIALHIFFPLVIIPVVYHRIICHVNETRNEVVRRQYSKVNNPQRSDMKLTKTVKNVIIALYVIWVPVFIIEAMYTILYVKSCIVRQVDVFSVVIAASSCSINPILYSYKNADIRKSLKERISNIKMFLLLGAPN